MNQFSCVVIIFSEDGGIMELQNIDILSHHYMVSYAVCCYIIQNVTYE